MNSCSSYDVVKQSLIKTSYFDFQQRELERTIDRLPETEIDRINTCIGALLLQDVQEADGRLAVLKNYTLFPLERWTTSRVQFVAHTFVSLERTQNKDQIVQVLSLFDDDDKSEAFFREVKALFQSLQPQACQNCTEVFKKYSIEQRTTDNLRALVELIGNITDGNCPNMFTSIASDECVQVVRLCLDFKTKNKFLFFMRRTLLQQINEFFEVIREIPAEKRLQCMAFVRSRAEKIESAEACTVMLKALALIPGEFPADEALDTFLVTCFGSHRKENFDTLNAFKRVAPAERSAFITHIAPFFTKRMMLVSKVELIDSFNKIPCEKREEAAATLSQVSKFLMEHCYLSKILDVIYTLQQTPDVKVLQTVGPYLSSIPTSPQTFGFLEAVRRTPDDLRTPDYLRFLCNLLEDSSLYCTRETLGSLSFFQSFACARDITFLAQFIEGLRAPDEGYALLKSIESISSEEREKQIIPAIPLVQGLRLASERLMLVDALKRYGSEQEKNDVSKMVSDCITPQSTAACRAATVTALAPVVAEQRVALVKSFVALFDGGSVDTVNEVIKKLQVTPPTVATMLLAPRLWEGITDLSQRFSLLQALEKNLSLFLQEKDTIEIFINQVVQLCSGNVWERSARVSIAKALSEIPRDERDDVVKKMTSYQGISTTSSKKSVLLLLSHLKAEERSEEHIKILMKLLCDCSKEERHAIIDHFKKIPKVERATLIQMLGKKHAELEDYELPFDIFKSCIKKI